MTQCRALAFENWGREAVFHLLSLTGPAIFKLDFLRIAKQKVRAAKDTAEVLAATHRS